MSPLAGLRALDLMDGSLGAYAGRLLASLGVDVVKVEPPDGDSLRAHRPFLDDVEGPQRSLRWLHLGAGKRGIALDLDDPDDQAVARRLAATVDIVLENRPVGYLAARGLGHAELRELDPRIIVASITPFGQTGPRSGWKGTDIVGYATGGLMFQTGEPDEPPVRLGGHAAEHLAGMYAVVGVMAALTRRTGTGAGDHVDVSVQEAVAATFIDAGATYYQFNDGLNPTRVGTEHAIVVPVLQSPCTDGSVVFAAPMPHQFRSVLAWCAEQGVDVSMFDDPDFDKPMSRLPVRDLIHYTIREATAKRPKTEVYDAIQARGIPCAPVNSVADLAENVQLAARTWFTPLDLPEPGRTAKVQGPAFRMGRTPLRAPTPAPTIGEHGEQIRAELGAVQPVEEARFVTRRGRAWGTPRALTGLRVLDMTIALAGPWAGRVFATEGAEVIRVETAKRVDTLRQFAKHPEKSGSFINTNAGKLGITLDISTEPGRELARRLVAESDVLLENFRPGVLERAGLGWDEVRTINPDLIMCSMPAQGETGPHREYIAYAPALTALAGFTYLTGYPESKPTAVAPGFIDLLSGAHAVIASLAALHHRDRTGEGQHIDLSQTEAAIAMLDANVLEYFANGRVPQRQGNRDPNAAPHGCYPCAGEDRWVVVAVQTDDEWRRLATAIGRAELASDPGLATRAGRAEREADLDAAIAAWTRERDPQEAMAVLQEAGVPAGAVQTVGDLLEVDGHLRERGYYEPVQHPVMGTVRVDRAAFRLRSIPGGLDGRAAPLLGEHDDEVFGAILGLSEDEIAALRDQEVIDGHLLDT